MGPRHALAAELAALVGDEHVLTDASALRPYRQDKSPFPPVSPGIVVRPGNVDEVSRVLALANARRVPVVPRGAGFSVTGLPGRGNPGETVVLDVRRLDRILDIDPVNMTVTAQAGVICSDLDAAVAAAGFSVRTVGVPIQHVTLGGMLSGVIGGGISRDYSIAGSNASSVLGITVVLPSGEVLQTGAGGPNVHRTKAVLGDADGPAFTPLFLGDGGSLGVKVEVTLTIEPRAEARRAAAWTFRSDDGSWDAMVMAMAARDETYRQISMSVESPSTVLYVVEAADDRLADARMDHLEAIMIRNGGQIAPEERRLEAMAMATSDSRWTSRFIGVDRGLVAYCAPVSEARHLLREVLGAVSTGTDLRWYAYLSPFTRHAVYATVSVLFDRDDEHQRDAARRVTERCYELVVEAGGYCEAHQGAGSRAMASAWSVQTAGLYRAIKSYLDPSGILNPDLWNGATGLRSDPWPVEGQAVSTIGHTRGREP